MNINFNNLSNILGTLGVNTAKATNNNMPAEVNVNVSSNATLLNSLPQNLNIEFNVLTSMQQAALLKDLLSLPKELEEFLTLMAFDEITPENLQNLVSKDTKGVVLQEVQQLLDTNSKEVINKLLLLSQPAQGNWHNFDQMKELVSLVNQVTQNQNPQTQEILKNIILTYLPWFPLQKPQDIELKFQTGASTSEEDDISLVIYVATINLGKFKITLTLSQNGNVEIEIENDASEELEDKTVMEDLLKRIDKEMEDNKIQTKTNAYFSKPATNLRLEKKEVSIHPSSKISPVLVLAAHTIIKIIFEFDEKISLLDARKAMIDC